MTEVDISFLKAKIFFADRDGYSYEITESGQERYGDPGAFDHLCATKDVGVAHNQVIFGTIFI